MADMKAPRLTGGQRWLAAGVALFGLTLTPMAFAVMYVAVSAFVRPSLGHLDWTVPVGTEAGFTGLFLAELLLEWIGKPLRWLPAVPYTLAAASLALNAGAGDGTLAGIVGHEVLPVVFFGYLIAGKAVVRRLAVTDEARAREVAMSDASAYARDILRSALGVSWRFRTPVLLRRQLRSGRLPATVRAAVESGDAARWERSVEAWITAAVVLPERSAGMLAAARAEASQGAPASAPRSAAGGASGGTGSDPARVPASASATTPAGAPQSASGSDATDRGMTPGRTARGAAGRHARLIPSKATTEELAALVVPLLATGQQVSKYKVIEVVREEAGGKGKPSIGDKRAGEVLALARERAGATVLQMGARKHA